MFQAEGSLEGFFRYLARFQQDDKKGTKPTKNQTPTSNLFLRLHRLLVPHNIHTTGASRLVLFRPHLARIPAFRLQILPELNILRRDRILTNMGQHKVRQRRAEET